MYFPGDVQTGVAAAVHILQHRQTGQTGQTGQPSVVHHVENKTAVQVENGGEILLVVIVDTSMSVSVHTAQFTVV